MSCREEGMLASPPPPRQGLYRLAELSIRFPVTVCMIFVTLIVMGAISLFRIPLVLLPDIDAPFLYVSVPYPNASPAQVEETITKPLEEALGTVAGIKRITAGSSSDEAWVELHFGLEKDLGWLRSEVRERLEQVRAELPSDVNQILIHTWNTSQIPILEGRISAGRDLRNSYDFLDLKIKKPLEQIPGVAEVQLWGVARKEIDIRLRLDDLKRHRVDAAGLFRRMDSVNLDLSVGRLLEGETRYGVLTQGDLASLERIRQFPVRPALQLQDIADVALRDPVVNMGRRLNGEYAVSLEIRKTSDANTVATVEQVLAKIDQLNQDPALQGIEVLIWHNAGREITRSLSGLLDAGTVGALLSVAVLFLFLRRLGATLIIGFAIPFSIISAVGFLHLLGNSLNLLSMMGLMLSTGMLVDNAVVVLESILQQIEKGEDRLSAARKGTREVVTAVLASTLTSVIIFVPLVFGKTTDYSLWLSHTGVAIMITLICSLFASLTLIPLGAARFLPLQQSSRMEQLIQVLLRPRSPEKPPSSRIAGTYLRLVGWHLRHRFVTGFVIVPALVASSFYVLSRLPDNSPDASDLESVSVRYEFSENFHYAKIEHDFVRPVEDYLLRNRDRFKIKNVSSQYGNNWAWTSLYFDETQVTVSDLTEIREEISRGLPVVPGAEISMGRRDGAQNENWFSVNLYGDDSLTLMQLSQEAKKLLKANPEFMEVYTASDRGREEVQIEIDRLQSRKFGISTESVAEILSIVARGRQMRGFRTAEGETEIWIRLQPEDLEDLEDLKSLVVGAGADGREIILSQVARLSIAKTPASLRRENRRTYSEIHMNYTGEKKEEGRKLVSDLMGRLNYPAGYGWSYGFWTEQEEEQDRDFYFNLLLALFMVYFVMASLFESLAHPFAIMLSLVFALVGVSWFLLLTGTPFNMMAMIGLMILTGIVVNNGIVLIDHINNLRRRGRPRSEAIMEGCRERLRPILMTATTTVVGLFPLAFGTSGIMGLRYFPMARTVMGGLIASTLLTLVVLPTYYVLMDDLSRWLRRTWHLSDPSASPPAQADDAVPAPNLAGES